MQIVRSNFGGGEAPPRPPAEREAHEECLWMQIFRRKMYFSCKSCSRNFGVAEAPPRSNAKQETYEECRWMQILLHLFLVSEYYVINPVWITESPIIKWVGAKFNSIFQLIEGK
eukprot:scpid109367/ scgid26853/ 